jgi:hypothetical protein
MTHWVGRAEIGPATCRKQQIAHGLPGALPSAMLPAASGFIIADQ